MADEADVLFLVTNFLGIDDTRKWHPISLQLVIQYFLVLISNDLLFKVSDFDQNWKVGTICPLISPAFLFALAEKVLRKRLDAILVGATKWKVYITLN